MANIHPDIKPNGLGQRQLVDALYMICSSLQGIAAKLDDDGTVTDTTYEALCITALFNLSITDSRGNRFSVGQAISSTIEEHQIISQAGISDAALLAALYQITNCVETMCEQLDADAGVPLTTYEANCFTAKFLHIIENAKGNSVGNGTAYYFRPGGVLNQDELVDWLYNAFDAIETLTEQLDTDVLTDSNYEALWFTATCLMIIENGQGNTVGNSSSSIYGLS